MTVTFTGRCGWLVRWVVLICLLWLLLTMASAYDTCPYGYYWVEPLEKCLPCRDICIPDRTAGCARHCKNFSTTIRTTTVPTTNVVTAAQTTVTTAANIVTNEGTGQLMKPVLIATGVVLTVGTATVVVYCLIKKRIPAIIDRLRAMVCRDAIHHPVLEEGESQPMTQV